MTSIDRVYDRQKLALLPFSDVYSESVLFDEISKMGKEEKNDFHTFLMVNNLGPSWLENLGHTTLETIWLTEKVKIFQDEYRNVAMRYLQQMAAIQSITSLLESNSIHNAFFKGVQTRELVYQKPATRSSCDIDLLIEEKDKTKAIDLLTMEGYELHALAENLTHEVSLSKNNVSIDLHWHILRPGRVPKSFTAIVLKNRIKRNGYWSLRNEDNLFILLTHPVFSKYSIITQSRLDLILDLVYWIKRQNVDWDYVLGLLSKTGLRTAAWIMLKYLHIFTGSSTAEEMMRDITPNSLKKWYLQKWIDSNLPARYQEKPFLVKACFTLFAHDSFLHAFRFLQVLFMDRLKQRNAWLLK